jgi:outer membrane protein OmpA-like peptidoglycan-associated protein
MNAMKTMTLYLTFFSALMFLLGCASTSPKQESSLKNDTLTQKQMALPTSQGKSVEKKDIEIEDANSKILLNCFKTSKTELEQSCKVKIKEFLSQTPLSKKRNILIEVHTDKVGDSRSNLSISKKRAYEAASSLYYKEYKYSKVYYAGLGENEPLRNSQTHEDNIINRRLKIIIKDKYAVVDTKRYKLFTQKKKSQDKPKQTSKNESKNISKALQRVNLVEYTGKADTGWIYFGKAELKEKITISCAEDTPREVRRRSIKGHAKEEFLLNAYKKNIKGDFGKYSFRMAPIAVFEDGYLTNQNPNILLFESKKSPKVLTTIVNSYRGEKGMLYRVFVNKKNSVKNNMKCMDIVIPYKTTEALFGVAYFMKNKRVVHEELKNILYK